MKNTFKKKFSKSFAIKVCFNSEMSMAALPLLRRTRGGGSGSFQKKKI
jgi:hypothetical protein